MIVRFNKVKMHNFLSYEDVEVDLLSKGFCLVSGQNNYRKDSALSNGSGKSTVWSAICFAITGETLSGVKNNLRNIYTSSNESYVELQFSVDKDEYILIRYIEPKSDLKINKNHVDISGKGIRESEKILGENLPDLSKDLISSTILLGQGLPNRFSSFSPSGRKELLERLTKSDFMIEDIKQRISNRLTEITTQKRSYEDSLLINQTSLTNEIKTLENANIALENTFGVKKDFSTLIENAKKLCNDLAAKNKQLDIEIKNIEAENEKINSDTLRLTEEKASVTAEEFKLYSEAYNKLNNEKTILQNNITYLTKEIRRLKEMKDICPTCGQKIPWVLKPDTTIQEEKIKELEAQILDLDNKLTEVGNKHSIYLSQIETAYAGLAELQNTLKENKNKYTKLKTDLDLNLEQNKKAEEALNQLIYDRDNEEKQHSALIKIIDEQNSKINLLNNNIQIIKNAELVLEEHLAVVKKIDTLVKRDFRGYLLYNIIEYLNQKAKEYSQIVFGTEELNIYLDGNALDISYCNKLYEMLSGGEKQRVDIITQFAIRELLQAYFNYSSNILVLDEITDNLDKIATSKIFDLITDKLKDVESVFIISHHADELEIPVDSEMQVIKNENGISSIKEKN